MGELAITVDQIALQASWLDTNKAVREAFERTVPIAVEASRWGDELYGTVPIEVDPDETTIRVEPGTLAFWPDGTAVCLFWGPTPASVDETPVAASPVAPFAIVDRIDPLDDHEGDATLTIDCV